MEKIRTSRIKLADLRFFDKENNGVELSESLSKGILVDVTGNGNYENLFSIGESYPIFKRAPFSNITVDGDEFGTKVYYVSNELVTGPCWVLSDADFEEIFNKKAVTLAEIENYVLDSTDFFKDRLSIIQKRCIRGLKMKKIVISDDASRALMDEFFAERVKGMEKKKEN